MSIALMSLVWGSTIKDRTHLDVLNYLANCADDDGGNCFPGLQRIAKFTRCSERTVSRTIAELASEGWLEVLEEADGRGNRKQFLIQVEKLKGSQDVALSWTGKRVTIRQKRVTPTTQKVDNGDNPPAPPIGRPTIDPSEDPSISSPASRSKAKKVDPRHTPFREILNRYWKSKNPQIEMPWGPAEAGALAMVLSGSPDLTAEIFTAILTNRWKSEVNHSDRPSKWLHGVLSYAAGPIDRFGKPLHRGNGNGKSSSYQNKGDRTVAAVQTAIEAIEARRSARSDGSEAGSGPEPESD